MRRLSIIALSVLCVAWMSRMAWMKLGAASPIFSVQYDTSGPTLLPSTLTVNGTPMTLVASYVGTDAVGGDSATWAAADGISGGDMAKTEVGGNIVAGVATPQLDGGTAVTFGGADYLAASGNTFADIGADDIVAEAVVANVSNSTALVAKRTGAAGFVLVTGSNFLRLYIQDSAAHSAQADCTLAGAAWNHCLWIVDRSVASANGLMPYSNGVAGTGANPSAVLTMTVAQPFTIGAYSDGTFPSTSTLAYFRMWKCSGCLASADLTEENAIAKDRAAMVMGLYPTFATTYTPTTMTRASTAYLRTVTGGVSSLFAVGNNWLRVVQGGGGGLLPEPSIGAGRGNILLQSDDVSTSWSELDAGDTQSLNDATAADPVVDGATTADCNIADATDGLHGFSQAATLTAAVWTVSIFAKPGNTNWLYLSDDTVAGATSYFNVSTCAVGTKGAGAIDQFVDDYGDFCRVGISFTATAAAHTLKWTSADADNDNSVAGDAATQNTCAWGAQATLQARPLSYLPTTTATVARTADVLTYTGTGNASNTAGSAVLTFTAPSYDSPGETLGAVGSTTDRVDLLVHPTDDKGRCIVTSSSASQADVTLAGDIANGAAHTLGCWWSANYANVVVDSVEGTADTSVTVPASVTNIHVGHNNGNGQSGAEISSVKIYNVVGQTQ